MPFKMGFRYNFSGVELLNFGGVLGQNLVFFFGGGMVAVRKDRWCTP